MAEDDDKIVEVSARPRRLLDALDDGDWAKSMALAEAMEKERVERIRREIEKSPCPPAGAPGDDIG